MYLLLLSLRGQLNSTLMLKFIKCIANNKKKQQEPEKTIKSRIGDMLSFSLAVRVRFISMGVEFSITASDFREYIPIATHKIDVFLNENCLHLLCAYICCYR